MPFLVAPQNMKERLEIRAIEDELIKKGSMKEEERMVFENNSKMIALSSASYTFENLYKTYREWTNRIYSDEQTDASYFISQMGYEALPEEMIDKTVIEEAQEGGSSHSSFLREYCAQFTDGSDSYFSAKKMHECTIPDGESPTTFIKGKTDVNIY
jgi:sulfite reductase beta subunit-like hemoprotein